jgi:CW-type Zinc Finger
VSSGIVSEDALTFAHTFDLVLEVAPQLATDVFVLLLDGDRATWQAAKHKFRNVVIVLCLFHASENMKKRFGPLCRSGRGVTNSSTVDNANPSLSRWIQCQNPDCSKWRKLPDNVDYPVEFHCAEVTWSANSINCDTPQDEDFKDQTEEKLEVQTEVIFM